jgi:uncharacterized protein (TIGR02453 family)
VPPPPTGRFRGFPPEAVAFYHRLEADNSRSFWQANKAEYERVIRDPIRALVAELEPEFGPFHTFRPYNDVRFSKTKVPYKTHTGSIGEADGGTMYYFQLSGTGLMTGAGYYAMAADQLTKFRAATADDTTGAELVELAAPLVRAGYRLTAIDELKTAPRGYPKDHPRIDFLRRKGLVVMRDHPPAAWLHTASAKGRIVKDWRAAAPLCRWLDRHVGPSELPPDDRFR